MFPFLTVFAAANTALINMLMASRLLYGLARQDVLPRSLGKVSAARRAPYVGISFSTLLAMALIGYVAFRAESPLVLQLSGTTSLLLLLVFTLVNVACVVLRRDNRDPGPLLVAGVTPVFAAALCLLLVGPWVDRDPLQWRIAGGLLGIGVVLWVFTWLTNRGIRAKKTGFRDIDDLGG